MVLKKNKKFEHGYGLRGEREQLRWTWWAALLMVIILVGFAAMTVNLFKDLP